MALGYQLTTLFRNRPDWPGANGLNFIFLDTIRFVPLTAPPVVSGRPAPGRSARAAAAAVPDAVRGVDLRGLAAVLLALGVVTVLIIGAINGGRNPNYVLSDEALATVSTVLGAAIGAVAVYLGGGKGGGGGPGGAGGPTSGPGV